MSRNKEGVAVKSIDDRVTVKRSTKPKKKIDEEEGTTVKRPNKKIDEKKGTTAKRSTKSKKKIAEEEGTTAKRPTKSKIDNKRDSATKRTAKSKEKKDPTPEQPIYKPKKEKPADIKTTKHRKYPPNESVCYILSSTIVNRCYIGFTVNLTRRIRQHNGEIKGGARGTRYGRPWEIVGYISGFPNETTARQYEWAIKHCRKGGWGVNGRINAIEIVLNKKAATDKCIKNKYLNLSMNWLCEGYEFENNHDNCEEEMRGCISTE